VSLELRPPQSLRAAVEGARSSVFRLETLQTYDAQDEAEQLAAFLDGRPQPPDPGKAEWTAFVRRKRAGGVRVERVHVCREPLTLYLRYELTWSYAASVAAGEDVRILPLAIAEPWPVVLPPYDFWLLDEARLLVMHYDAAHRWLGVEPVSDPSLIRQAADAGRAALARAVPWQQYVASRPELAPCLPRQAS
jgi:hypothetical protein